ncbi:MAG: SixA phosphatase family protein [Gemmatimonadaceae bacterium]
MKLLVLRHAVAEDREDFAATGEDDSLRPLTKEGIWKMERIVKGLRVCARSIDLIATSPYTRAAQTAELIARGFSKVATEQLDALKPDSSPKALLPWLRKHQDADSVAVVGHEPHLGVVISWLLAGKDASFVGLGKGGACMLEFESRPAQGGAIILWTLTPSLLRRLGS